VWPGIGEISTRACGSAPRYGDFDVTGDIMAADLSGGFAPIRSPAGSA
jgi:hypothetical protein